MANEDLESIGANITRDIYASKEYRGRRESKAGRAESRMVIRILDYYALAYPKKVLLELARERTGHDLLPFALFHRHYPTFPVWLVGDVIGNLHKETAVLLASPTLRPKSRFYKAYDHALEVADSAWTEEGQPVGVVFEWLKTGAKGVLWVLHDYEGVSKRNLVIHDKDGLYFLQPFNQFLEGLSWSPG